MNIYAAASASKRPTSFTRRRRRPAYWTVRFFRDSQNEEYLVVLLHDGPLHSVHHTLAEEAPGANLTKETAQQRAESYLSADKDRWTFRNGTWSIPIRTSCPRTDHVFTWEQKAAVASLGGDEGAHVRVEVRVQGEEASGYRVYIHLPEDWLRKQNQNTLATTAHANGLFGLFGAFIATVLVVFLRSLKQPSVANVPWRRLAKWCLVALIAFVLWVFTNIPQYLARYPTENSLSTYLGMIAVSFLLGSAALYGLVFALLGLAWFFLARAYGSDALPGWHGVPALYYRDALVAGACGFAIVMGFERLRELVSRLWPVAHYGFPAGRPRRPWPPRLPLQALPAPSWSVSLPSECWL